MQMRFYNRTEVIQNKSGLLLKKILSNTRKHTQTHTHTHTQTHTHTHAHAHTHAHTRTRTHTHTHTHTHTLQLFSLIFNHIFLQKK
jgi:hypothetical protein